MSTRCQLLFEDTRRWTDDGENHARTAQLLTYKHSDGYPDGVVPLLRRYYRWMPRHEFEYFTATWFYYVKRRYEKQFIEDGAGYAADNYTAPMATDALGNNHGVALSYGVCADGKLHGDINHFYVVDLDRDIVEHYSGTVSQWETPAELREHRVPDDVYALAPDGYDDPDEMTPVGEGAAPGAPSSSLSGFLAGVGGEA